MMYYFGISDVSIARGSIAGGSGSSVNSDSGHKRRVASKGMAAKPFCASYSVLASSWGARTWTKTQGKKGIRNAVK
jgi:hypothetical protein